LTQQEFAERIGLKRNTIGQYEIGRNNPTSSVINLICREYGVNEEWLKTGEGEIFAPKPVDDLEVLVNKYNLSHNDYVLLEKFIEMSDSERKVILDYIIKVAATITAEDAGMTIDEKVADYRRQLEMEEQSKGGSSALQNDA
jgi:transcriptional regulator with XRE-family HTH domain